MKLTTGARWRSQACETQIIVVRPAEIPAELMCGGVPMVKLDSDAPGRDLDPGHSSGTLLGKRYTLPTAQDVEVLVTTGGEGSLAVGDEALVVKESKPLPSSD